MREGPVLRVATTQENLGLHNFEKGEAAGMRALLVLPNTVIQSVDNQLKGEDGEDETATE